MARRGGCAGYRQHVSVVLRRKIWRAYTPGIRFRPIGTAGHPTQETLQ